MEQPHVDVNYQVTQRWCLTNLHKAQQLSGQRILCEQAGKSTYLDADSPQAAIQEVVAYTPPCRRCGMCLSRGDVEVKSLETGSQVPVSATIYGHDEPTSAL